MMTNLNNNFFNNSGAVKLWSSPNLSDMEWRLSGTFGKDIYSYFFIPPRFILKGEQFYFITPFNYIFELIITDHNGPRPTEKFWRLSPTSDKPVDLKTDKNTFLPYLETVTQGQPNFTKEKCYLIPTQTDY